MDATTLPEQIGNFRIVSKLGQGGMGAVYRAIHGTLERPVALKVLPAEFATNPEYVSRFLREARTCATLRHDNVVQVYDAGEHNGQYFIAMELVEGSNLLKYAEDKGKIGELEGLDLLLQASSGLAAAHSKGLVHRDIKPENLLLGKDGVLRIVDFGLVMDAASNMQLTVAGAFLGTPMYTSPEQVDGEQADLRSDIYSLGITFYRILVGQPPFTGTSVMNLLYKHKFEAPPDPKALRPDMSDDLRNLILHMIAKRREDRPQTAATIVEIIQGIKAGRHIGSKSSVAARPMGGDSSSRQVATGGDSPTILGGAKMTPGSGSQPGAQQPTTADKMQFLQPETEEPISKVKLGVAAAVVLCVVGFGAYKIFGKGGDGAGGTSGGGGPSTTASLTPQQKFDEKMKKANKLFEDGKFDEAITAAGDAKVDAPNDTADTAAKKLIDRAQSFRNYKKLMADAAGLEAANPAAALTKYREAIATGGDEKSAAAERVKAIELAQSTRKREQELAQLVASAEAKYRAGEFALATAGFAQAAQMTTDAVQKATLEGRAKESQREGLVAEGDGYATNRDWAGAIRCYKDALALKTDPALVQKLRNAEAKIGAAPTVIEGHKTERPFDSVFADLVNALRAKNLQLARKVYEEAIKLDAAKGAVNADKLANKFAELEGREALAKGEQLMKERDFLGAKAAFQLAEKVQLLQFEARDKIAEIDKLLKPKWPEALSKTYQLVGFKNKDKEALLEISKALTETPNQPELLQAKTAMENLMKATQLYALINKNLPLSANQINNSADARQHPSAEGLRQSFEDLRQKIGPNSEKPRAAYLAVKIDVKNNAIAGKFENVAAAADAAKSDAKELLNAINATINAFAANAKLADTVQALKLLAKDLEDALQ